MAGALFIPNLTARAIFAFLILNQTQLFKFALAQTLAFGQGGSCRFNLGSCFFLRVDTGLFFFNLATAFVFDHSPA